VGSKAAFFCSVGLVAGYYYIAASIRSYLSGRWIKVDKPILVVIPIGLFVYFFFLAYQITVFQGAKDVPWLGFLLGSFVLASPVYAAFSFLYYANKKRRGRLTKYAQADNGVSSS